MERAHRDMERSQEDQGNLNLKQANKNSKSLLWDCGSTLYDSFELKSFERQLDSAINSRSMSMPHLADRKFVIAPPHHQHNPAFPPPVVNTKNNNNKKPSSRISRSLHRFLKSVFKSNNKQNSSATLSRAKSQQAEYFVVYDKSGALSTIPEAPEFEFGGFSPEINSLVRRTPSERFAAATSIGISCA